MSDVDYLKAAMSHPLLRERRFAEVAQEYADACAHAPDDVFLRRRACALLGHLTRRHLADGTLPQEVMACFWGFVQAVPAFPGQAGCLQPLDQGPRGPVLEAMERAAAEIRRRAKDWASEQRRGHVRPRHLLLVSLPHSGVSAVAPILETYLAAEGFRVVDAFEALPGALAEADASGARVFAWCHPSHEQIAPCLRRADVAVAYLHRDPRDVAVSSIGADEPDPSALFTAIIGYRLDEFFVDSALYLTALAEADPAVWAFTFDTLKADVPGAAARLLRMLDLPVDEARVSRLADAYSFRSLAGHAEGEGARFRRVGRFVVRKGTSGQWRERFNRNCALVFAAKYGHLLLAGGWTRSMDWIDEVRG